MCWKPSEKTPLCAVACQNIIAEVFKKNNVPEGVCGLIVGGREVGEWMAADKRSRWYLPISTRMGSGRGHHRGRLEGHWNSGK
jgi:aldehyde dehydrogenase (NAD+)